MEREFTIYSELLIAVLNKHFNSNYGVITDVKTTRVQPIVFTDGNLSIKIDCYAVIEEDGNVGLYL